MSDLLEAARYYLARGWMPVYVQPGLKAPLDKDWPSQRHTEADLEVQFSRPGNIGLILGEASGGLVDVDLDCPEALEIADQYLPPTPAVTGRVGAPRSHWWYVSDVPATRQFRDPLTKKMIVELRSNGGQTLVGPSIHETGESYETLEGEPARVSGSMLEACVKGIFEEVVRRRYGALPQKEPPRAPALTSGPVDPDHLERRALAYLAALPPAVSGNGGHAATYTAATALVHGFGLGPDTALQLLLTHYNPRCLPPWTEKELRHKVDDAATKEHERPFGWLRDMEPEPEGPEVDLSGFKVTVGQEEEGEPQAAIVDPGLLPEELLRVPGFIDAVMDYSLTNAPFPEPVLAFCSALALQATLAGRKVRDPGGARSNLYILGLADPGTGKDFPRQVNEMVLREVGMAINAGDNFASGEGIEDRMSFSKVMLFQTDEIDNILTAIAKSQDGRAERIMEMLLKFFSASSGIYHMRVKAGSEPGLIDQPSLTLYGTAVPLHYYQALSEKMLTNGFFARMLVFEAGPRSDGQEPREPPLPASITGVATHWADFRPGRGNLADDHPVPLLVPFGPGVAELYQAIRQEECVAYRASQQAEDTVAMALWARAGEKARRLALVYACSENHLAPVITTAGVEWAWAITSHQTRRMLFKAQAHVAENPFHASCLRLKRKLLEAPGQELAHSVLLKRMKMDARSFHELITTLEQQGDIQVVTIPRSGSPKRLYRLPVKPGGVKSGKG